MCAVEGVLLAPCARCYLASVLPAWVDALPRTVTAFFAPKTRQCVEAQRNCVDEARKARDAFATEYGFAKEAVPLVWLHLDRTQDPFELVDG